MAVTDDLILRIRAAGARRAAKDVSAIGTAVDRTGRKTTAASKAAGRFDSVLKGTNRRLSAVGRGLKSAGSSFSALTFPILGAAAVSGKLAIDFDKAMRNVNSIAGLPERKLLRLKSDVLALAGPTAQAPQTLAEGLYDLVSSGFDAQESLKIVKSAAIAATAGLTDTATSTKTIAAVLNAYKLPASAAKKVSDELFQTVKVGVITFEELAQNIGDTLPFASSLGVSLAEVGAATSTMTKQGLGAPETMTRIRNLLQTMIKPGEGLKQAFKELGVESGEALIKQKGLQGALDALIGTTDGSKAAVATLFPNIRALGGALALTGKNSKGAGKDLKSMEGASGAAGRSFAEQSKSSAVQWQKFMATLKAGLIVVAAEFLPVLNDVTKFLGKVFKAFQGLEPGQKKFIIITLLVIGVLGPLLIIFGAIAAAGAALATTAGAVALGVVAVGAAAIYAYTHFKWFRDIVQFLWKLFKITPLGLVVTHLGDIAGAAGDVVGVFKQIPGAIKSGFVTALNWMIDRINDVIGVINAMINTFNKLPGPDIGTIGEIGHVAGGRPPRGGVNYGGFSPLTGRPIEPTGPTPFGGTRTPRRFPRRPGAASAASTAGSRGAQRDTVVHTRIDLDGKEVAKSVTRHSTKRKSVS